MFSWWSKLQPLTIANIQRKIETINFSDTISHRIVVIPSLHVPHIAENGIRDLVAALKFNDVTLDRLDDERGLTRAVILVGAPYYSCWVVHRSAYHFAVLLHSSFSNTRPH